MPPTETVDDAAMMAAPARVFASPRGRIYAPPTAEIASTNGLPVADPAPIDDRLRSLLPPNTYNQIQGIRRTFESARVTGNRDRLAHAEARFAEWLDANWRIDGVVEACERIQHELSPAVIQSTATRHAMLDGRTTRVADMMHSMRGREERGEILPLPCSHIMCSRYVSQQYHLESIMNRDDYTIPCEECRRIDPNGGAIECCNCSDISAPDLITGTQRRVLPPRAEQHTPGRVGASSSANRVGHGSTMARGRSPTRRGGRVARAGQSTPSRSDRSRGRGRALVHFRMADTPKHESCNTHHKVDDTDEADLMFHTEPGGKLVFTEGSTGKSLARIKVGDDIQAIMLDPSIDQDEAYDRIEKMVPSIDAGRVNEVAKHLKEVKRRADDTHKWRLSTRQTHQGLARVMCAVKDVLAGMCHLGSKQDKPRIRWLLDSCSDTNLISREAVTSLGLWDKVDKSRRISMGTAGPDGFRTEGAVLVPLPINPYKRKQQHTVELDMHVADMGDKCLVSQQVLKRNGWKIVDELNKHGQHGAFLIAPDGVIFALHEDEHGFPMLDTDGAPIAEWSKPDQVRVQNALATEQQGQESGDDDVPDLAYTPPTWIHSDSSGYDTQDSRNSDSEDDGEAFAVIADELANKAAKAIADEDFKIKKKTKSFARTRQVVHTPESWHALMHCGRLLSEATAVGSDARFNLGGKVKEGKDLTTEDLELLEIARKACNVCKQTKITAPAARKGEASHASHRSTLQTSAVDVQASYKLPRSE